MSHRVVIVGSGHVGSTAALLLALEGLFADIVLVDKRPARSHAEADDMMAALPRMGVVSNVRGGSVSDCANADVVVIAAAAPVKLGQTRNDMFIKNAAIIGELVPAIENSDFSGLYLIVSNPVDLLSYFMVDALGVETERVLGMGTLLDSMRLEDVLRAEYDTAHVHAFTLGEHGEGLVVDWSRTLADERAVPEADRERLRRSAIDAAYAIMKGKGSTSYGIAAAVVEVLRTWQSGSASVLPLSMQLSGEYGIDGISLAVPAAFDCNGVPSVQAVDLDVETIKALQKTAGVMRSLYRDLRAM